MQTREELRAQHSALTEKCYAAKRKQKCKHGKHLKLPKRALSHHEEPAINMANKLPVPEENFPKMFLDHRLLPAALTITSYQQILMASSRYYISINSLARPPRSVKISGLQPSY